MAATGSSSIGQPGITTTYGSSYIGAASSTAFYPTDITELASGLGLMEFFFYTDSLNNEGFRYAFYISDGALRYYLRAKKATDAMLQIVSVNGTRRSFQFSPSSVITYDRWSHITIESDGVDTITARIGTLDIDNTDTTGLGGDAALAQYFLVGSRARMGPALGGVRGALGTPSDVFMLSAQNGATPYPGGIAEWRCWTQRPIDQKILDYRTGWVDSTMEPTLAHCYRFNESASLATAFDDVGYHAGGNFTSIVGTQTATHPIPAYVPSGGGGGGGGGTTSLMTGDSIGQGITTSLSSPYRGIDASTIGIGVTQTDVSTLRGVIPGSAISEGVTTSADISIIKLVDGALISVATTDNTITKLVGIGINNSTIGTSITVSDNIIVRTLTSNPIAQSVTTSASLSVGGAQTLDGASKAQSVATAQLTPIRTFGTEAIALTVAPCHVQGIFRFFDPFIYGITVSSGTLTIIGDLSSLLVGMVSYWKMEESATTRQDSYGANDLLEVP